MVCLNPGRARIGLLTLVGAATFAIIATQGCRRAESPARAPAVVPRSVTTSVTVRNHNWADIRVYLYTGERTGVRLGIVPRWGAVSFVMPSTIRLPSTVRFAAIPLDSSEPHVTEPIVVDVGSTFVFTIEHAAPNSSLVKLR